MDTERFNILIKRVKSDENAFNEIYKYYFPRIVVYLTNTFNDYHLCMDAAQEFFGFKLFNISIPDNIDSPLGWIYVSCKNIVLDLIIKKNGKVNKVSVGDFDDEELAADLVAATLQKNSVDEEILAARTSDENYYDVLEKAGLSDKIIEKFKKLDRITVEIYLMHYWEGFSIKEISELLHMNYDTVKSKFLRGKKYLKKFSLNCTFLLFSLGL